MNAGSIFGAFPVDGIDVIRLPSRGRIGSRRVRTIASLVARPLTPSGSSAQTGTGIGVGLEVQHAAENMLGRRNRTEPGKERIVVRLRRSAVDPFALQPQQRQSFPPRRLAFLSVRDVDARGAVIVTAISSRTERPAASAARGEVAAVVAVCALAHVDTTSTSDATAIEVLLNMSAPLSGLDYLSGGLRISVGSSCLANSPAWCPPKSRASRRRLRAAGALFVGHPRGCFQHIRANQAGCTGKMMRSAPRKTYEAEP